MVRSIGIYTFSNFFAKGISFLLIPLFTNPLYLTPGDNGLLSLFSNSIIFLMPFISLGLIQSTSTDFFKFDKKEFSDFFTTGFVLPVAATVLAITGMFIFRDQLQHKYGFPSDFFWIIPLITFLTFCSEQLLGLIRNNNQPNKYLMVGMSRMVMELGLAVLLIVGFRYGWYGRVLGILVSYIVVAFYAFYYFKSNGYIFGLVQPRFLRSEIVYALPMIVLQGAVFVMNSSDKFFLAEDHAVVGIYSIACTFASVILILCTAVLQFIFPQIYSMLSEKTINFAAIRKYFYGYLLVMIAGTILIMIATPVFYKLFINEKYHSALRYSYFLALGYFFWTLTYFFYSFLMYFKQKKRILLLSVLYILITLTCNYFFIRAWRDEGAAISVFTSYALVLIITILFTKQYWEPLLKNKPLGLTINGHERTDL